MGGQELYLGNSGTSARFLSGIATVVDRPGASIVITGNARMRQRPMKDMVRAPRHCSRRARARAGGFLHGTCSIAP